MINKLNNTILEQKMPHRFVLYDSLESLSRGNLLIRFSNISCTQHLEGVPLVSLVSDKLLKEGWVEPYDQLTSIYFKLSKDGEKVYKDGVWRYNNMSWKDKILGRIGMI